MEQKEPISAMLLHCRYGEEDHWINPVCLSVPASRARNMQDPLKNDKKEGRGTTGLIDPTRLMSRRRQIEVWWGALDPGPGRATR